MDTRKEDSKPAEKKEKSTQPAQKKPLKENGNHKKTLQLTAIALAGIALLCSIYAMYLHFQLRKEANQTLPALTQSAQSLKKQQQNIITQLKTDKDKFHASFSELKEHVESLDSTIQSIQSQPKYQASDWLLLRARYYLELAQINAHWGYHTQETIALLQQADMILAGIHDKQLFPIRQAIAQEMTELQALPKVDLTGILSQLDALQNLLTQVPMKKKPQAVDIDTETNETTKSPAAWHQRLTESLHLFEKLVVIRHHEQDIEPMMGRTQATMARERIRLDLEQAQWAVMQKNEAVYHLALKQTLRSIQDGFDPDESSTKAFIKGVTDLQQAKITAPQPELEQSLNQLNAFIKKQSSNVDQPTVTDNSNAGGNA